MAGRRRARQEAAGQAEEGQAAVTVFIQVDGGGEAGGPGRGGPGSSNSFYTSRWRRRGRRARPEAAGQAGGPGRGGPGSSNSTSRWRTVFIQVDGGGEAGGPGRRRRARPEGQAEEGQAAVTVFIQVDGRRAAGQAGGPGRRRARQEGRAQEAGGVTVFIQESLSGQAGGGPGRRAGMLFILRCM